LGPGGPQGNNLQQMGPALMQAVNAQNPLPNPKTPNQRIQTSDARMARYNAAKVSLNRLESEGLEEEPTYLGVCKAMALACQQMLVSTDPQQVVSQLTQHLAALGTAMNPAGMGVPAPPPQPGTGITAGQGPGILSGQQPNAAPPPMA
jgi:hypothetical protein